MGHCSILARVHNVCYLTAEHDLSRHGRKASGQHSDTVNCLHNKMPAICACMHVNSAPEHTFPLLFTEVCTGGSRIFLGVNLDNQMFEKLMVG